MKQDSNSIKSFGLQPRQSRGRRWSEPSHPYRTDFQRDRDRVVHSKAFRRLEAKRQVFAPDHSDHFRNRLTHTIEVSLIARTIASALRVNSELCEVLALCHDIGHPPFGHDGEQVLNQIMAGFGSGFDHNLHALRIVEDFEVRYPDFRGLNLTFEVREGIVKHSSDYETGENLYVDLSEYCLDQRPPLEAQVIDLADEIAYNVADLDDGLDSGMLNLSQIIESVELFRIHYRATRERYPDLEDVKLQIRETLRRMIDGLVGDLIHRTRQRLRQQQIETVEDVRCFPTRLVALDPESCNLNQELKLFLQENLYHHSALLESRQFVGGLLTRLFAHYCEFPQRMPPDHVSKVPELGVERVVCDYIAGMTDLYAQNIYNTFFGNNSLVSKDLY